VQATINAEQSNFPYWRARQQAIVHLEEEIIEREKRNRGGIESLKDQIHRLKVLAGFPTDSKQLRCIGIISKAKIMKAHLKKFFPQTKFSVKCDFYDGRTIYVHIIDGDDPIEIKTITDLYMDKGSESVDYDNFVEILDERD
jgi:hypothetical protein